MILCITIYLVITNKYIINVVLLNIFVEQHLFEIEIFCNNLNCQVRFEILISLLLSIMLIHNWSNVFA